MHPDGSGSSGDAIGQQSEATGNRSDEQFVRTDDPVRTEVTTSVVAGVTLVRVVLRNDVDVALRVRISNELDGPALPPRRESVPEAGWDADGFTGTVPADGRIGVGYACPATPTARSNGGGGSDNIAGSNDGPETTPSESAPVSVDCLGPADCDRDTAFPESERVTAAVRSLGRSTPPADAVPVDAAISVSGAAGVRTGENRRPQAPDTHTTAEAAVPPPVASWLDGIETRIGHAEALSDATADEAATVLDACGGVDGVASLPESITEDTAALRAVADRIDDLAARATAADPEPVISSLVDAAADSDRAPATSESGHSRPRTDGSVAEHGTSERAAAQPSETR